MKENIVICYCICYNKRLVWGLKFFNKDYYNCLIMLLNKISDFYYDNNII